MNAESVFLASRKMACHFTKTSQFNDVLSQPLCNILNTRQVKAATRARAVFIFYCVSLLGYDFFGALNGEQVLTSSILNVNLFYLCSFNYCYPFQLSISTDKPDGELEQTQLGSFLLGNVYAYLPVVIRHITGRKTFLCVCFEILKQRGRGSPNNAATVDNRHCSNCPLYSCTF